MASLSLTSTARANLVDNGSFERDFDGWTTQRYFIIDNFAHSGTHSADTSCGGQAKCLDQIDGAYVKQTLGTTIGSTYTFSFWLAAGSSNGPNGQAVYWNGALVGTFLNVADVFTRYTVESLVATSANTVLQINGFDDPDELFMDDVSVEPAQRTAVPEPMTFALLGAGLAAMRPASHRRRSRASRPAMA